MASLNPLSQSSSLLSLWESDQREVAPVQFATQNLTRDPTRPPLGSLTQEEFNHHSRQAVKECVKIIEEGLVQNWGIVKIYSKLEECLSRRCRDIVQLSGSAHADTFCVYRESDPNHYVINMGPFTPYPQEGIQLHAWLSRYLLTTSQPSRMVIQGDVTFTAQLYTRQKRIETYQELEKNAKKTGYSPSDEAAMQLLDTTVEWDNTLTQRPEPSSDAPIHEIIADFDYYVARVITKTQTSTAVTLSTYVVPVELDNNQRYQLHSQIKVLSPNRHSLPNCRYELMCCLKKILNTPATDIQELNRWIMKFARFYTPSFLMTKGTNWCFEVLLRTFYHFNGFRQVEMRGMPLAFRALITPFLEDMESHFNDSFVENPCLTALKPKSLSTISSEKCAQLMPLTSSELTDRIRRLIDRRVEFHRSCLILLRYRFQDDEKSQIVLTPEQFQETCQKIILKQEKANHQKLLSHWENLQQQATKIQLESCCELAKTINDLRADLIHAHMQTNFDFTFPYLTATTRVYTLKCHRIYGSPQFLKGNKLQKIRQEITPAAREEIPAFPIEFIAVETLKDLSQLNEHQIQQAREQARREYVEFSPTTIHFERYITPQGERHFVYHPVTAADKYKKLILLKLYSETYPKAKPLFAIIDKTQELFCKKLEGELSEIASISDMFAVLNHQLSTPQKPSESAAQPSAPRLPAGTSVVEIAAFLAQERQHPRKPRPRPIDDPSPEADKSVVPCSTPSQKARETAPQVQHVLKDPDNFRIFNIIWGMERGDATWKDIKKCLANLGFSITSAGGKIYHFEFENTVALVEKEGTTEYFMKASKNFHEPHINRKHTAKTPLVRSILNRFKELLEKAGMTPKTVSLKLEK